MNVADDKRVVVPLDKQAHSDFKAAAARAGQSMASVARWLFTAWARGEIKPAEKDERHG